MPSLQKQHKSPSLSLAILPACISAIAAGELWAQEGAESRIFDLEEIVVTATKRESTIQDLPFSINAQTQSDIQRTGASNLEDLSRSVAGLTIQNLGRVKVR